MVLRTGFKVQLVGHVTRYTFLKADGCPDTEISPQLSGDFEIFRDRDPTTRYVKLNELGVENLPIFYSQCPNYSEQST
jgi:hypothetical protein